MPKWLSVRNIITVLSIILNLLGGTKTIEPVVDLPALVK